MKLEHVAGDSSEVAVARTADHLDGDFYAGWRCLDTHRIGEAAEDLRHLLRRRFRDADLVRDPAEVGLFKHGLWFEVGAETDRRAKREGDTFARHERHGVLATFERRDPTVEEGVRRDLLPPKVVDAEAIRRALSHGGAER
jgi:hypothetical protein